MAKMRTVGERTRLGSDPRIVIGENMGRVMLLINVVGPVAATVYDDNGNATVELPVGSFMAFDIAKGSQAIWRMAEPGGGICDLYFHEINKPNRPVVGV